MFERFRRSKTPRPPKTGPKGKVLEVGQGEVTGVFTVECERGMMFWLAPERVAELETTFKEWCKLRVERAEGEREWFCACSSCADPLPVMLRWPETFNFLEVSDSWEKHQRWLNQLVMANNKLGRTDLGLHRRMHRALRPIMIEFEAYYRPFLQKEYPELAATLAQARQVAILGGVKDNFANN